MSLSIARPPGPIAADPEDALYPDSDGEPIAENTLQFEWIVTIKGNLDMIFADRGDVFVAGDLLWYPVQGDPKIRTAPDALVAIGRPKGYRGSYRQWREGGIAPQVVFEVLSPGNRAGKMKEKFWFYERFGVLEYYIYDPDTEELWGYERSGERLIEIPAMDGWVSPLLSIRFDCSGEKLVIRYPDGRTFLRFDEMSKRAEALANELSTTAEERDALAKQLAQERAKTEALAARLREMGVEP